MNIIYLSGWLALQNQWSIKVKLIKAFKIVKATT